MPHPSTRAAVLLSLTLFATIVSAQDKVASDRKRGEEFHRRYLAAETARLADNCLKGIDTLDKWETRRGDDRQKLFEMLGLDPLPEKTDLKPVVTGKVERDKFTVEKLHFQSRPGLYVTANLYLPKQIDKPAPTILYLCGHGPVKKNGISYGNKVSYQHHGTWFAEHGYVCLVLDTLQLGEIEGIHHGTHREKMWWWNSVGYTPAGVEAWNSIRALDYLETRPEVDRQRIGVTGRSGGGAYSWWIAALDDRIKVAVPVAGITDLTNHVVDGAVEGHCDCMYLVNTHQWDYANVAALVAPRPLLIANTDSDRIFPLDGVLRVHDKVKEIYKLYGAADKLGLQISPGPHKDTQELQIAAFRWFDKHLRGEERVIDRAAVKQFEPEELKVFDKLPDDQRNTTIHETFTAQFLPPAPPTDKAEWERQSAAFREAVEQKIFRYWPEQVPDNRSGAWLVASSEHDGVRLSVHEVLVANDLTLPLFYIRAAGSEPAIERVQLRIVHDDDWQRILAAASGKFDNVVKEYGAANPDDEAFAQLQRMVNRRNAILVFAPRNHGAMATADNTKYQTHLRRRYMLLGQTLEGMQVWDTVCALRAIRTLDGLRDKPVLMRAENELAPVALYAALHEPVARVSLHEPPTSHRHGGQFLNVLRYLDMPQAMALAVEHCEVCPANVEADDWRYPAAVARLLGGGRFPFQPSKSRDAD